MKTTTLTADVLDGGFRASNSDIPRGLRWHLALTPKRTACNESISQYQIGGEGHRLWREHLCPKCLTLFEASGRTYSPETCPCGKC